MMLGVMGCAAIKPNNAAEPTKPESVKEKDECNNNCATSFDWCMKSNISTDKYELCENALKKCLQGCGSEK
ncbi:MAG: hypothetical protein A2073_07080 [Deltaproteobacteria bacterium GWC2_42_11]|nr:MAG: hypothetical protein A2073_07080 [Deltaproteobacteria bacterium GWC2_42_11]HBO83752.1 hypothetical protein [Deltaproteobacteria bacterium]